MNQLISASDIAAFAISLLLCSQIHSATTTPVVTTSHAANFKTGANIVNLYTNSLAAPDSSIPPAHQSLVDNTCEMLSSYELMSYTLTRHTPTVQVTDLLQFLEATLNHGCLHVRGLLGGEVSITTEEVGSGGNIVQETMDSCSNLSYLHTLCTNITLQAEWQALLQTSRNIRNAISVNEGLRLCEWVSDNVVATPHIQSLFNICTF